MLTMRNRKKQIHNAVFTLAALACIAGSATDVIAGDVPLPQSGSLFFARKTKVPKYIGDFTVTQRPGHDQPAIIVKNGKPNRVLVMTVSKNQPATGLRLDYENLHNGTTETAGYVIVGERKFHAGLGFGQVGILYQTAKRENGELKQAKNRRSTRVFFLQPQADVQTVGPSAGPRKELP